MFKLFLIKTFPKRDLSTGLDYHLNIMTKIAGGKNLENVNYSLYGFNDNGLYFSPKTLA
jgi:hypothetical protein